MRDREWCVVNFDQHGDGSGEEISYEQGRAVPEKTGELVAAFTGKPWLVLAQPHRRASYRDPAYRRRVSGTPRNPDAAICA